MNDVRDTERTVFLLQVLRQRGSHFRRFGLPIFGQLAVVPGRSDTLFRWQIGQSAWSVFTMAHEQDMGRHFPPFTQSPSSSSCDVTSPGIGRETGTTRSRRCLLA